MRNSVGDKHSFEKELYSKLYTNKPCTKPYERNPIVEEPEPRPRYYDQPDPIEQPKKKGRMLARGDFSEKHQGTFALSYDNYDDYKPSKKCYQHEHVDPIKPPEFIPPANFRRPDRNPIVNGDVRREPEARCRPDQISNVFNSQPYPENPERRNSK